MTGEENDRLALEAVKGNQSAYEFICLITSILHVWDDLIDKDKTLTNDQINECFWRMLVTLPRNQFYASNFQILNPTLMMAIQNWMTANRLEDEHLISPSDTHTLEIAFIIRSTYCELIIQSALICGGYEWSQDVSYRVRRMWHDETLHGYTLNLYKQQDDALKENKNGL